MLSFHKKSMTIFMSHTYLSRKKKYRCVVFQLSDDVKTEFQISDLYFRFQIPYFVSSRARTHSHSRRMCPCSACTTSAASTDTPQLGVNTSVPGVRPTGFSAVHHFHVTHISVQKKKYTDVFVFQLSDDVKTEFQISDLYFRFQIPYFIFRFVASTDTFPFTAGVSMLCMHHVRREHGHTPTRGEHVRARRATDWFFCGPSFSCHTHICSGKNTDVLCSSWVTMSKLNSKSQIYISDSIFHISFRREHGHIPIHSGCVRALHAPRPPRARTHPNSE